MSDKKNSESLKTAVARGLELGGIRKVSYILTAVACSIFFASTFGYARYGSEWVDELDDRIAEVVSARARRLAEAGRSSEAIELYRHSFTLQFDDPQQRIWAGQRYLVLLMKEELYSEAVAFASEFLSHSRSDVIYSQFASSLHKEERYNELVEASDEWYDFSAGAGNENSRATARYYRGVAHENLGQSDRALEAYLEGAAIDMSSHNAYHAARILIDDGEGEEALALLDQYVPLGSGWRLDWASTLQQRLRKGL